MEVSRSKKRIKKISFLTDKFISLRSFFKIFDMELSHKINKVEIRNLQISDYTQLSQSFRRVYSDGSDVFWTHQQIEKLIAIFPEGQFVTVVDEKIVGCALSIIVDYD